MGKARGQLYQSYQMVSSSGVCAACIDYWLYENQ